MEANYITVKEFAARCNVSQQAVYKQLQGKLKEYVRKDGDKTLISAEAIEVMGKRRQRNAATAEQELIEVLRAQLDTKDKQIEALTEALQTAQQLTRAAQAAQLQAEARLKLIEDVHQEAPAPAAHQEAPAMHQDTHQAAQEEHKESRQGEHFTDETARKNTAGGSGSGAAADQEAGKQGASKKVSFWQRWFKR